MNRIVNVIGRSQSENSHKNISRIRVKIKVKDLTSEINITDLMLQTGNKTILWNGHPSEVRWIFNE